jgi:hypothetical protein
MIGYGDTDGIYWIYNTENHKIFRSRDVKFNEKSILDTSISITINNDSFKEEENDQSDNEQEENVQEEIEPIVILKEEKTVEETENSNDEENKTDKVKRQRTKRKRYQPGEYDTQSLFSKTCFHTIEPFTYEQALNSPQERNWRDAINAELDALDENETWEISKLPIGKVALSTKWVFKIKTNIIMNLKGIRLD